MKIVRMKTAIFENGLKQLARADAVKALQTLTGVGRTACYSALKSDGRFAAHLSETAGLLSWQNIAVLSASVREQSADK